MGNPDNAKPEQPQSYEEAVQQFAQMSVETWSRTLVAETRRVTALESRVLALEGEVAALKRIVAGRIPPKGGTDA